MSNRAALFTVATLLATVCPTASTLALAEPTGDSDAGHRLAQTWCSTCHVVGPEQDRATSTGAPTFTAIAAMKTATPSRLHVFFQRPHHRMPDLHLSNTEMDDVIAYIVSLRK